MEGAGALAAILERGHRPLEVWTEPDVPPAVADLVDRAEGAEVVVVRTGVLARLGTLVSPQPVVTVCALREHPPRLDRPGPVLALDGVSDPGNVGTIVRIAEAVDAAGVVCAPGTADPWGPKAARAAAGALTTVPVTTDVDLASAIGRWTAAGRRVIAAVAHGGLPPEDAPLGGPVVLVVGHERRGVRTGLDPRTIEVTVPLAPPAESLNVAVATAVVAFEGARQRRAGHARPDGPPAAGPGRTRR